MKNQIPIIGPNSLPIDAVPNCCKRKRKLITQITIILSLIPRVDTYCILNIK